MGTYEEEKEAQEARILLNDTLTAMELMIAKTVGHSADFRIDGAPYSGIILRCQADYKEKCVWVWLKPFDPELSYPWGFVKIDSKHFDTVYKKV